jgi:hypothetical protein
LVLLWILVLGSWCFVDFARAATNIHWSLKPITCPEPPATTNGSWLVRNPIDRFILAKLAQNNLSPSPEAERRVLIRRLSFDLIGLPPTPAEVLEFQQDTAADAYEKVVDRLLASPHYGERWARHWLDVVRFAETHGFEMNQPRPNAWLYRDYVIRAFNEDKPYDRFILEQFAGDLFGEDAATGFLVGGPWDMVKSPDAVLTATQRADELHDMVSTAGSAFLGLTVGCARCHDHKFDPIPQKDYYAIKACLAGVQHGERALHRADDPAREREAEQARQRVVELDSKLAAFEPLACAGEITEQTILRPPVNARRNVERFAPVAAKYLRFTIARTTDAEPCIDELEVYTAGPEPKNVALGSLGTRARASSVFPNSEIHRLEHINDGKVGNSHSWISNERGRGWVALEFPEPVTIDRVVWGRDREQKFTDRLALKYRIEVATVSNEWQLAASSADRQAYNAEHKTVTNSLAWLSPEDARQAKALAAEQGELEARLKELTSVPMVYAGTFVTNPPPTHRFNRGDPMQEREVVEPGVLSAIPVSFCLSGGQAASERPSPGSHEGGNREPGASEAGDPQPPSVPDQQRRLALAKWIADPANPLPARVLVNRLWLYHFGEGLVSTPSDFGVNGARPTHPELLDWLAAEFIHPACADPSLLTPHSALRTGTPWSIKHIQRLIVTSATYRQASLARANCLTADAGARLLWRFPPRRLEAEALRDAILAISGNLDLRAGGPGFSLFEPNDNYVRVYNPREEFGPAEWRRMIYLTKVRMHPDGVFGAFDCPDGGQIAPKRMRSTTPLQALNLLNSGFMVQQADRFASRLEHEGGGDLAAQVRLAFELVFSRTPEPAEGGAAERLAAGHGLPVLCRALFNSNEFVFIE